MSQTVYHFSRDSIVGKNKVDIWGGVGFWNKYTKYESVYIKQIIDL